jgi:hypothetical protein
MRSCQMGTHFIDRVTAVRDAVDRLEWQVRIVSDFYGVRSASGIIVRWHGNLAFYRESIPPNSMPGPQFERLTLAARWLNAEEAGRLMIPEEKMFRFATELPTGTLDRIETFRRGGRLFARVEGQLHLLYQEDGFNGPPEQWLATFTKAARDGLPKADIHGASLELTRDVWNRDILGVLRPPGRCIMEIQVPSTAPASEVVESALRHVADAQTACDDARHEEVLRICYRALDRLGTLVEATSDRYGVFGKGRIAEQVKATKALCNPERHAEDDRSTGFTTDRRLAMHVLAVTSSLVAIVGSER